MIEAAERLWARIAASSAEFSRPTLESWTEPSPPCTEDELAEVLRGRPETLLAYGDGGAREDYRERVMAEPPRLGEALEAWGARVFERRRFGLVVQNTEAISETLARRFAVVLRELIARRQAPLSGASVNFFVGNYGLTPFGIHHDTGMELVHFHLGPGRKELRMWEPERWRSVFGSGSYCHRPEPWLSSASQTFTLGPGGVFFFPGRYYHIGNADEFSVAIAVVLMGVSRRDLLRLVVNERLRAEGESTEATLGLDAWAELRRSVPGTAQQWLREAIELYRAALRSNAFLTQPPRPRASGALPSRLRRVRPFPVELVRLAASLGLAGRGRVWRVADVPAVHEAVAELEREPWVDTAVLLGRLGSGLGTAEAEELLGQLVRNHVIEAGGE